MNSTRSSFNSYKPSYTPSSPLPLDSSPIIKHHYHHDNHANRDTMTNPTLLIIPGSFMPSSMFQPLITQLKAHHIPAVTHDLRSTIAADPTIPTPDMYTDAAFFHSRALDLLNQGKDIMLFAHSYGGMVASEMMKGLPTRRTEGKGRVVGIIYQSAMVIPVGKCLLDGMGDGLPPILDVEVTETLPPLLILLFAAFLFVLLSDTYTQHHY